MSTQSESHNTRKNKTNWAKNSTLTPATKKKSSNTSKHPAPKTNNNNNKAKYYCQTKLGSGTFGIVIGCMKKHNSNPAIAIKYLDTHKISMANHDKLARYITNFEREKTIHSLLDHPNIVKYIAGIPRTDFILEPSLNISPANMHFFLMEYCDQGTLASYLLKHNGKPVDRIDIICQCFAGLYYLFQVGVIHLDIKPQNILVTHGPTFKLADFGLAKQLKNSNKATIEQSQLKCGTMEYIPYFAENTTYFRDLYAFYCLLYYITTHSHLNSGKPVKSVTKRWSSMDTEPIRPNRFTDTEFSYLGNIVQILAKLQTDILSILKQPAQQLPPDTRVPLKLNSKPTPSGREFNVTSVPLHWAYNPVHTVSKVSKLAGIKGVLSFGSNSEAGSSSSSANNNINPILVKQTQRRKLVLNRYDLYAGYYKMLDAELDNLSKTHGNPSIVIPEPIHKMPVTVSTALSGTKTKAEFENANNAVLAGQPLTPVKPRY